MDAGDVAQIITALAALGGVAVSLRNSRTLHEVKSATNGIVEKMGAAREAKGLQEGRDEAAEAAK